MRKAKKKKAPVKKKKTIAKKAAKRKVVKKRRPLKKSAVKKAKKPAIKKKATKQVKKKAKRPVKGFLGEVTHYFPKVNAAVIKLAEPLTVGDKIKIKGHTTDFTQTVASIQIDRVPITTGKKGDEIGLLVGSRVRRGDTVTKV